MIKPHYRAPVFGLGVALIAVYAARIGHGARYKLALFGDFHTATKGGGWADLGVALIAFLLGFIISRQMVTTHPPSLSQSTGLALVTSMAIGVALCVGTIVASVARSPGNREAVFLLTMIITWPYFLFTAFLPLIAMVSAWTAMWRFLCAAEVAGSQSAPPDRAQLGR